MSRLIRDEPEAKPPPMSTCAVCGAECIDMQVNQATLCDAHFDLWLKRPRDRGVGGPASMAEFVAEARAQSPAKVWPTRVAANVDQDVTETL